MSEKSITVLCFGGRGTPGDALALEIGESLQVPGVEFVTGLSPERILEHLRESVYAMDVAMGIERVTLVRDPDQLRPPPGVSSHDLDPAFFLRLAKSQYGFSMPVIAIPLGMPREEAERQVRELLSSL